MQLNLGSVAGAGLKQRADHRDMQDFARSPSRYNHLLIPLCNDDESAPTEAVFIPEPVRRHARHSRRES